MENIYSNDSNVIEVIKKDFIISKNSIKIKENINNNLDGILICYAPWCSHCVLSSDLWIKLSELFKSKFNFFSLNTYNFNNKNQDLIKDLNISVYPTYKLIDKNGIIKDYNHGKKEDDFIQHIMTMITK